MKESRKHSDSGSEHPAQADALFSEVDAVYHSRKPISSSVRTSESREMA